MHHALAAGGSRYISVSPVTSPSVLQSTISAPLPA